MTLALALKLLLFGIKIFVSVLLLLLAVKLALCALGLVIVGPPMALYFGFLGLMKALRCGARRLLHFLTSKTERADPSSRKEESSPVSGFDPYRVLEIAPGASQDEIRRAFRSKMAKNHPDKVATLDPAFLSLATKRAKEISAAFDMLSGRP